MFQAISFTDIYHEFQNTPPRIVLLTIFFIVKISFLIIWPKCLCEKIRQRIVISLSVTDKIPIIDFISFLGHFSDPITADEVPTLNCYQKESWITFIFQIWILLGHNIAHIRLHYFIKLSPSKWREYNCWLPRCNLNLTVTDWTYNMFV